MTAYLPSSIATLEPDADTAPFWDACRRGELRLQRCAACGRFRHPPLAGCPDCGSRRAEWVALSGAATVYSFTIVRHAVLPELAAHVPYNVAVVEPDEAPGVRLITNVVDVAPEQMAIGLRVELAWDEPLPGVRLPRFRRAAAR
jgi:uncharacterized OB-fold protein